MIVIFDLEKKEFSEKKIIQKENDYVINKIVTLDKNYIIGTSKSKCGLLGCEYESFIEEYK